MYGGSGNNAPIYAGMGMNMGMGMPGMRMPGQMPGMMGMPGQMPGQMGMMGGQMGMMPGQMGGMPGQMPGMMPGMPPMSMPGMAGMPPMSGAPAIPGVQPSVMMPPQSSSSPAPASAAPTPPPIEWAIPQQKRVQYMAQFQANDKAKTGFLAAVQARTILLQTGLAQQTLASVWNISDIDKVSLNN